ncbi:MAG: carboxymuconolactone decarboxylase family protein [Ignavibacteriaceae bacterium]|nr:carboxymuconolactone decarboxylase family protein [Ignavibacterium sp.]MCC6253946.1 carboxymuconolactone decarboxylase family protein [Ignavibacteriaceae bacterium]HRN25293.1 carboxymuconolactone decarboxylase family protein [Ignavibacteriaceae bacterium]HRP93892.1 carboxymuconolactone decarboxylase family protein [Ignavibacteriaceae bacterium]HRQ52884.1 carboxymuconolactone decarboxylase family protein [Ignavibacteriaceae bacterium]
MELKNLSEIELLALLTASSVLRKEKRFDLILKDMLAQKYSIKKIYEALLQTYLFAGFPSALISLKKLSDIKSNNKNYEGYDFIKYKSRGEKNCRKIYGNKFDKLISNVKSFSPELSEWLIVEGYGKVLGRNGLSLKEREICIVSILAALKFRDQLYSHINGAIRLKTNVEVIKKVINNLEIISAKSSAKFGLGVLGDYQKSKNKSF